MEKDDRARDIRGESALEGAFERRRGHGLVRGRREAEPRPDPEAVGPAVIRDERFPRRHLGLKLRALGEGEVGVGVEGRAGRVGNREIAAAGKPVAVGQHHPRGVLAARERGHVGGRRARLDRDPDLTVRDRDALRGLADLRSSPRAGSSRGRFGKRCLPDCSRPTRRLRRRRCPSARLPPRSSGSPPPSGGRCARRCRPGCSLPRPRPRRRRSQTAPARPGLALRPRWRRPGRSGSRCYRSSR